MDFSAIVMLIFGCGLLYGGLGFFIYKAASTEKNKNSKITISK